MSFHKVNKPYAAPTKTVGLFVCVALRETNPYAGTLAWYRLLLLQHLCVEHKSPFVGRGQFFASKTKNHSLLPITNGAPLEKRKSFTRF